VTELPLVVCLCPAYRAPHLIANAIAMFERQTYPHRRLLVVEDSGEYAETQWGADGNKESHWIVVGYPPKTGLSHFQTLPEKYNEMVYLSTLRWPGSHFALWEQDDVYLPRHLEYSMAAMPDDGWSHPSLALTDGSGGGPPLETLIHEPTGHARMHAALVASRAILERVGWWPETDEDNYDLQMLQKLRDASPPGDQCSLGTPQYFFRWITTQHVHVQCYGGGNGREALQKAQRAIFDIKGPARPQGKIVPKLDEETAKLFARLS
jgi:hypothetical protein